MNFEQKLLFLNLETNDVIPVCAKPECDHKSSSCNAFFGNGAALRSIYYYRGYYIILDFLMAWHSYAAG